jgi:hypothetical protein
MGLDLAISLKGFDVVLGPYLDAHVVEIPGRGRSRTSRRWPRNLPNQCL